MIKGIDAYIKQIQPLSSAEKGEVTKPTQETNKSFKDFFSDAIREVGDLQKTADQKIESMVLKRDDVEPHDAMIALEKANVAFQLMSQIRTKIVRAYEEIMRTPL